jgi:hypothetical protein
VDSTSVVARCLVPGHFDEKDARLTSQNSIRCDLPKACRTKGKVKFQVLAVMDTGKLQAGASGFALPVLQFVFVAMVMGTSPVVCTIPSFRSSAVVSTSASSSLPNGADGCTSVSSNAGRVDVGRRGFLGALIAAGVGGIYAGVAVGEEMAAPEVGLQEGRLRGCDGRPPCVSTSAFQSPSRFMPPWTVSR